MPRCMSCAPHDACMKIIFDLDSIVGLVWRRHQVGISPRPIIIRVLHVVFLDKDNLAYGYVGLCLSV